MLMPLQTPFSQNPISGMTTSGNDRLLSAADTRLFEMSFQLAEQSLDNLEVPVGCVLALHEKEEDGSEKTTIIGRGNNEVNK